MRSYTLASLLACLAALTFSTSPASAAPAAPTPDNAAAMLRGAHFSPDTPAMDVYLTKAGGETTKSSSGVSYGDVGGYQRIEPGSYTVSMRPAGAEASTPPAISWALDAKPGSAFTALAIGMHDSLEGRVLSDDLNPPPAGQARVRIIQASDRAQKVDVTADDGLVLAAKVPFTGTTDYTTVPAGELPVTARSVDKREITTTTKLTLTAGGANTLIVLNGTDQPISTRIVDDAVGTDLPPTGPPETGGGAMAIPDISADARRVAMWGLSGLMILAAAFVGFGFRQADQL
jgi:hypothetical protein